jgi:hypothetical protein
LPELVDAFEALNPDLRRLVGWAMDAHLRAEFVL